MSGGSLSKCSEPPFLFERHAMELEFHPLANIFPLIEGAEFDALVEDIRLNGQREPIVLLDGKILDGRNRYRACLLAGENPASISYFGDDAVSFVVSLNLRRRHLDESQRAVVAAKLANMKQGSRTDLSPIGEMSQSQAAEMLNVGKRSVERARAVIDEGASELIAEVEQGRISVSAAADVATLPKPQQAEIVARGEKEILEAAKQIRAEKAEVRRAERIERIVEIAKGNTDLSTDTKYPVIYADPPWRYDYAETENRAIENQYPTMTIDEICNMPVSDLATDDAILFMWTTAPKLEEAFKVVSSWGFTYRSCAIWDKQKIGMGYYFRIQHEILLVATRGNIPTPAPADRVSSVISIPRSEHSAKPVDFYEIIEKFYPALPKIELFCRSPREGWAVWGNQSSEAA
jgi:N6-adenosine-specific RNA methylase IME4/ParB-like chromosome segregation protein Spo0J